MTPLEHTRNAIGDFLKLMLIITCAMPAQSAEWIRLADIDDDELRAYDAIRTTLVDKNKVKTWKRYKLIGHDVKYPGYAYSITEWEIDCVAKRQRILSAFDYSINGKLVNSDTWQDSQLRPIPPDSKGEAEANAICARLVKAKN